MKKFASSRSLNKVLAQCDASSREYEEIQAVERKWHLHLAAPRRPLLDWRPKASLFFAAPPPPKRAPSTTLTLRSKSMTAELEELGEPRGRGRADGLARALLAWRGSGVSGVRTGPRGRVRAGAWVMGLEDRGTAGASGGEHGLTSSVSASACARACACRPPLSSLTVLRFIRARASGRRGSPGSAGC